MGNKFYFLLHLYSKIIKVYKYIIRKFKFNEFHYSDTVVSMEMIRNPKYITLKKNVSIGYYARVECVKEWYDTHYSPQIIFNEGVRIEQNLHMTCANKIEIGADTKISAGVTITDIIHPYEDINNENLDHLIEVRETIIGKDCRIYNGAVILPGIHVGDYCIIGANSVVTKNIPSYSVVAGNPAKIIKKYDFDHKQWVKI